ncbi:MAG: 5-guanidino-2-oxopentanoate decarboxylase [Sulfitobacter sp.]
MITCGENLTRLLHAYGIDTVFGIPGVHTVDLYRGFDTSGMVHVTPRHEQGAAFMAHGYAMASGKPAACYLISGPGILNALTAMGQAYSDSIPMLVVASNNQRVELGTGGGFLHETKNQGQAVEQVTAFTHQLLDPVNLDQTVARCFAVFEADRPRPVCIEIPRDVLKEPGKQDTPVWPAPSRAAPAQDAIAHATELLATAKKPIILLGGGAWEASKEATALAERLGAPVVSTCAGKGIVADDHPLSLGCTLPFAPVQARIKSADMVLTVGSEMSETDQLYTYTRFEIDGALIRVDIDPEQLSRSYQPALPIVGDAAQTLAALLAALPDTVADVAAAAYEVADLHSAIEPLWQPIAADHKPLLDIIRAALPRDGVLVTESTKPGYTSKHYYPCYEPRTLMYPNGYGTLGAALPTAIGAKIAAPERDVICLAGDGGVLFTIEELATAVELGLTLPIIVWNNRAFGEIRDSMVAWGLPRVGVDLQAPDYCKVAEDFGCQSARPTSLQDVQNTLHAALSASGPTLIEIDADQAWVRG